MVFRIISDETEENIRVKLSCGEYFFRREYKILPVILMLICMVILYFVLSNIPSSDDKLFGGCTQVIVGIMMIIYLGFSTIQHNHDVIMTVFKDGIEVKSELQDGVESIFIEKMNIASIYVQLEKINYERDYLLDTNKDVDVYSIILKCKKPIYLQVEKDYKQKFLLYRELLTEKQYLNSIEPQLNMLKKKLKLSTKKNIKVIKEFVRGDIKF